MTMHVVGEGGKRRRKWGMGFTRRGEVALVLEGIQGQRGRCVGDLRQIQGVVRPRVSVGEGEAVGEHVAKNEGERERV